MSQRAAPNVARRRSYELTQEIVQRQASVWAYVDVFRYLALATLLCIPLVFLLRRPERREGAVAAH
jgi:MFS transporter, DHA2 family, multidrug resistance protein